MANAMVTKDNSRYAVQHRGDTLVPTIKPGEWVEIDPSVTAFSGPGIYLTAWRNFEPKPYYPRQVPQLRRLDYIDGELHSVSPNPFYPPFKVNLTEVVIGGKALAV